MSDGNGKKQIINRLKRVEGQVRGLQGMVTEERSCQEILTLLSGIRSALNATGDLILENYLHECQQDPSPDAAKNLLAAVRLARG